MGMTGREAKQVLEGMDGRESRETGAAHKEG
jgi:hypothetical protein